MTPTGTTIDVVVPTYNGWDLTRRCLGALAEQTVGHTVIVADDASSDDTPRLVKEHFPHVRVIARLENLGFGATCNDGAAAGVASVIVLLNNDVTVEPDFLERLVAPLADPAVGTVAALLMRPGMTRLDSFGLTVDRSLAGFARLQGMAMTDVGRSSPPPLLGPSGGAGAYRRSAWDQVSGFDDRIFLYGEDLDLALRLRAAGWRSAESATARGIHLGGATTGRGSAFQRAHAGFSRGYMLRRYRVLRSRAAAFAVAAETIAVCGDVAVAHDLSALRGRVAGWRAAKGLPPRVVPEFVGRDVGFREALGWRWSDRRPTRATDE